MGVDRPLAVNSDALVELAREAQAAIGLVLSPRSIETFEIYLDTLVLWRSRVALTAAKTPLEIVRYHILDSLFVTPFVKPHVRIADLGSGAGFPGIPLAIACPQSAVVLIESQRKRANFLRDVARNTRLKNVAVVEERAEAEASRANGPYDLTVCRAVGGLSEFLHASHDLLRSGGLAIAMKGPKGRLQRGPQHGFSALGPVEYCLHGGRERILLVYRKD